MHRSRTRRERYASLKATSSRLTHHLITLHSSLITHHSSLHASLITLPLLRPGDLHSDTHVLKHHLTNVKGLRDAKIYYAASRIIGIVRGYLARFHYRYAYSHNSYDILPHSCPPHCPPLSFNPSPHASHCTTTALIRPPPPRTHTPHTHIRTYTHTHTHTTVSWFSAETPRWSCRRSCAADLVE